MSKHLITKESTPHGAISWHHNGKDGQYCEAGETVKIKWQPTAGWGLQEVHYTDAGGNVVAIEGGEFVMPDSAIVIGATFKRFFLSDWEDEPYNPQPQPELPPYLTFTAGAGGARVGFIFNNWGFELPETFTKPSFQYSTDGGKTWQDYDLKISDFPEQATVIELAEGESVMFKGVNENLAYYNEDEGDWMHTQAYIDGNAAASGDVTSLLNGVGGDVAVPQYCYYFMFYECIDLTQAPHLPSTTLAENCYSYMFSICDVPSHNVATLNDSEFVFQNNRHCASLTIHAETPPTIGIETITGLKADCIIYVPAASVDAYKAAQYWSARAAYIQAMP